MGNGASVSKVRRFNLPDGEQSDDIRITSPSDGAVVHPGDTISVEVDVASGVKGLSGVVIASPIDTGMQLKTSPPYTFSVKIPESDGSGSGPLIGQQSVIALGARAGHQPLESAPVTVDVEKLGLPVSLEPQFSTLYFHYIGDSLPLIMLATFPDHSVFDVRDSTYLSFDSTNRAVATVDAYGIVTAVGPGTGSIVVTYSVAGKSIETKIQVPFEHPQKPTPSNERSSLLPNAQH